MSFSYLFTMAPGGGRLLARANLIYGCYVHDQIVALLALICLLSGKKGSRHLLEGRWYVW